MSKNAKQRWLGFIVLTLTLIVAVFSDELIILGRNLADEITYAITGRTASQREFDDSVDDICAEYQGAYFVELDEEWC